MLGKTDFLHLKITPFCRRGDGTRLENRIPYAMGEPVDWVAPRLQAETSLRVFRVQCCATVNEVAVPDVQGERRRR